MKEGEKIQIPMKIYSRNLIDKMHWSAKRDLRGTYQTLVRNQMILTKKRKVEDKEVVYHLSITAHLRRLYDYDNLIGGCKQLMDALSHEMFIWDDSPTFIVKSEYEQLKTKLDPFTVITRVLGG